MVDKFFGITILMSTMIVLCMLASKIYHKTINIVSIMVLPWCLLCGMMTLGMYGAFPIQVETCLIAGACCWAYALPCMFLQTKSKTKKNQVVEFTAPYKLNNKSIIFVNIVAIVVCIVISRSMWHILFTSGFSSARYYFLRASQDNTVYTTMDVYVLYTCFAVFIATILTAVQSILNKTYNKLVIFFAIVDLVLYVMAIAGRMTIFRFLFYLGIGFILKKGRLSLGKREKFIIILACSVLIYITSVRRVVNSTSIFQDIFYYFAGAFGYLNYIVEHPEQFITVPSRLYGRVTFGFILQPIEMLLYFIGFKNITFSDVPISKVTGEYYLVAPGIRQNHSCTAAFYFYTDFGMLGIVIGFAVLALITVYIYNKSCNSPKNEIFWQCMLLYISYVVFFTIWEYQLMSWSVPLTMAVLYLFTANKPFVKFRLKINR